MPRHGDILAYIAMDEKPFLPWNSMRLYFLAQHDTLYPVGGGRMAL